MLQKESNNLDKGKRRSLTKVTGRSGCEGQNFCPFTLDCGDGLKLGQLHRRFMFQRHVGTQEVVVGHKESGESCRAVEAVETDSGTHMVLESPVQTLNKLFQRPPLFRLDIKVLKAYDLTMLDIGAIVQGVEVVDAGRIRGITVGDENDFLLRQCRPDSFLHGDNGRQSAPVVGKVIGGNLEALGRDKEEGVVMLSEDLDVGFITR